VWCCLCDPTFTPWAVVWHWRNFTLKSGGDQWRRQDLVSGARRSRRRRREHRGAEWGGVWGGVSAPQPTRESGGASWAPPAGSGAEPRLLSHFLHILGHINWELLEKFQIPLWKSGGDSYQHFQKWWWQVVTSLHRHIQSAPMSCGVVVWSYV